MKKCLLEHILFFVDGSHFYVYTDRGTSADLVTSAPDFTLVTRTCSGDTAAIGSKEGKVEGKGKEEKGKGKGKKERKQ